LGTNCPPIAIAAFSDLSRLELISMFEGLFSNLSSFVVDHLDCYVVKIFGELGQILIVKFGKTCNLPFGAIRLIDQLQAHGLLNGLGEHSWSLLRKRDLDGLVYSHEITSFGKSIDHNLTFIVNGLSSVCGGESQVRNGELFIDWGLNGFHEFLHFRNASFSKSLTVSVLS
jgi:hypothetical protein